MRAVKTAFIFPGQGAQYVGMGRDLAAEHPGIQELFDEANRILGIDLTQLAFHGPPGPPLGDPPVLVVGAERDTLVPAGDVERTAAYYGTTVRWLPGIGHDVMLDDGRDAALDAVLAAVSDALG